MRNLALFAIGLVFGGGIGFVSAAGLGVTMEGHDHSDPAQHSSTESHGHMDQSAMGHDAMDHDRPLEIDATDAPAVNIKVTPDPMAGHNLHIMVENFKFAPERASMDHVPGEGHAHVYVNGTKLARAYGNWLHLDTLPKGDVTVEVSLNANHHQPLWVAGKPIKASTTLVIE